MAFVAIIGASKISKLQEERARKEIDEILWDCGSKDVIISGGATGIDTLAINMAKELDFSTREIKPLFQSWKWYKKRNLLIAEASYYVYYLVKESKNAYCYHCKIKGHVKSGACWTALQAKKKGKTIDRILI